MQHLGESSTMRQHNSNARSTQPGPHMCRVHNLEAKFFLNRPVEDLIPAKYMRRAENNSTVQRKPWIFRGAVDDARDVDQSDWSEVDIRYRGVFKTLLKVPPFSKGLWEGGSEEHMPQDGTRNMRTQAQVMYALVSEVGEMLDLQRPTREGDAVFFLKPRLVSTTLEYWTGYREKHRDGPHTSGFVSLEFGPDSGQCLRILPVSAVSFTLASSDDPSNQHFQTTKDEHLISALNAKFKLMLGQLLLHVRPLHIPGDKLPDQEIFLLGLHGSKLHLLRAYFPGQKISSLWCRREVPGPVTHTFQPNHRRRAHSTPLTAHASHIENYDADTEYDSFDEDILLGTFPATSTAAGVSVNADMATPPRPPTRRGRSGSLRGPRFYGEENLERMRRQFEATRLRMLDGEPKLRTFRVLGTQEYDLWAKQDFAAAVKLLAALQMYLLSGEAKCGAMQDVFEKHPINGADEGDDAVDSDSSSDYMFPGPISQQDRTALLKEHFEIEEKRLATMEEELKEAEIAKWAEEDRAARVSEAMEVGGGNRISSFREARKPWWEFVWDDQEGFVTNHTDDEGEMVVGNLM
ncbi:hypothetical protein N7520_001533 [Penicillium odoratum]|uniref:uncharacterized protein n=1 Tax=Penicillium odoratum TaxID=1167516 RepID=UPI0025467E37|nr:uncharacterized protein N7520_001533 [Penicillium odoratum]KAJ5778287.1 hypothetical protein N7520_001533 [Penicillium odoratum]